MKKRGRPLYSGMGELHLEIIVDRMKREFRVEGNVGKPQVSYKETIQKAFRGEGKFVRQSGGKGQYGHVVIDFAPLGKEGGFQFINAVRRRDSEGIHSSYREGSQRDARWDCCWLSCDGD